MGSISTQQEAMAMYGEMVDNDLVFDPNPVNLEPKSPQIWARGVSLVAPNTVAPPGGGAAVDVAPRRLLALRLDAVGALHALRPAHARLLRGRGRQHEHGEPLLLERGAEEVQPVRRLRL